MRSFLAFFKKELLESLRSGKFLFLGILFCAFGIMNPAIAKLTPWIIEMLSDELAETGMEIMGVTVDAITSWTQFFKNIPMALITVVLMYGGTFSKEYESESLVLIVTKGLDRYKIVISKALLILSTWSIGYWVCFLITYGYNAYFWDNSIAVSLMPAAVSWWLFGILTVSLIIFFSVVAKSYSMVLLGTGGTIFISYLVSLLPKVSKYLPTSLMNSGSLIVGKGSFDDYLDAFIIAAVLSIVLIVVSIPIFNKKQI